MVRARMVDECSDIEQPLRSVIDARSSAPPRAGPVDNWRSDSPAILLLRSAEAFSVDH